MHHCMTVTFLSCHKIWDKFQETFMLKIKNVELKRWLNGKLFLLYANAIHPVLLEKDFTHRDSVNSGKSIVLNYFYFHTQCNEIRKLEETATISIGICQTITKLLQLYSTWKLTRFLVSKDKVLHFNVLKVLFQK